MNKSKFRWCSLVAVSVAVFLVVIDMTILYTALPSIARELRAGSEEKLWILNIYSILMAALMPLCGVLADRYGTRKVFLIGLIFFAAASAAAACSSNVAELIAARAMLAIGGAAMMPASMAIIRLSFTDAKDFALAIGVWASIASGGAALGPVLGGLILEYFKWQMVFLINIPVVIFALILTLYSVSDNPGKRSSQLDWISCVQLLLGIVLFMSGIKGFAVLEYSNAACMLITALGILFIFIFAVRQLSSKSPLIDLSLLRSPAVALGLLISLVSSTTLVGFEMVLSQRLQLVYGLTPLAAGLNIAFLSAGAFFSGPLVGYLLGRYKMLYVLIGGLFFTIFGLSVYFIQGYFFNNIQAATLFISGLGIGAGIAISSNLVVGSVPESSSSMAGSMEGVSYELGASLGVSVFGSILSYYFILPLINHAELKGITTLEEIYLGVQEGRFSDMYLSVAQQAFEGAFGLINLICVGVFLCLLLGIFCKRNKVL